MPAFIANQVAGDKPQAETGGDPTPSWESVRVPLSSLYISPENITFGPIGAPYGLKQGGFGDVYRAVLHTAPQAPFNPCCQAEGSKCRDIAVKKLRFTSGLDEDQFEKRLSREVLIMSKLDHKNIVKLHGYYLSKEKDEAWLISNWVDGGNAKDYLAAKDSTADSKGHYLTEKLRLITDAGEGLLYLHSRDQTICHGDLKAQNLLVEQPEGRGQLCDFGLASFDDPTFQLLVTTSRPQGTTPWCSPSVLMGGKLSPSDDVWSFGSLAYEISTGNVPFAHDGEHIGKIVLNILHRKFPPNISSIPDPLRQLILGCWKSSAESQIELADGVAMIQEAIPQGGSKSIIESKLSGGICFSSTASQDPARVSPTTSTPLLHSSLSHRAYNGLGFPNTPPREAARTIDAKSLTLSSTGDEPCFQLSPILRKCLCLCGPPLHVKRAPRREIQDASDGLDPSVDPLVLPNAAASPEILFADPPQTTPDFEISVKDLETVVAPQRSVHGRSNGLLRAKLESSGEDVAVKVLCDVKDALTIVGDPLGLRRQSIITSLHEFARSSSNLRHPRINPILGYILVDGIPSLVAPWCDNGNIQVYLQGSTTAKMWDAIDQAAEGLEALHLRNPPVLHTSLKPENILVDNLGGIRLGEVGNIVFLEQLTSGITTCGKLSDIRWLPRIQEGWTTKSDVYCFGLLVLAIVTGRLPYFGLDDIKVALEHYNEEVSPACHSDLPEGSPLWKLLNRCWDVDPTKRPSMSALRAELKLLADSPTLDNTISSARRGSTATDQSRSTTPRHLHLSNLPENSSFSSKSSAPVVRTFSPAATQALRTIGTRRREQASRSERSHQQADIWLLSSRETSPPVEAPAMSSTALPSIVVQASTTASGESSRPSREIKAKRFWMHFSHYVHKENIAFVETTIPRDRHANTDWYTSIQIGESIWSHGPEDRKHAARDGAAREALLALGVDLSTLRD